MPLPRLRTIVIGVCRSTARRFRSARLPAQAENLR
ncbi:hypothetical protein SAVIM338S_06297 [Streptomyces avidinii]